MRLNLLIQVSMMYFYHAVYIVRPSVFLSSCPAIQSAHMGKAETSVQLLNIWLLFLFNFFRQFSLSAFLVQKLPSHICFSEYP